MDAGEEGLNLMNPSLDRFIIVGPSRGLVWSGPR